jgi:transposase
VGSARCGVGTQGPAPLMAQRQEFGRLIALGVNNSEACRRVGVHRHTGTRWRFGRTITSSTGFEMHYAPAAMTNTKSLSARFLSEDERVLIGDRVRAGASLRAIGRELGRAASTVSREVRRNRDESGRYRPFAAQRMAVGRLVRPKERRWPATRSCGRRSRGGLTSVGAPNRSPTRCGWSTPTAWTGTWSTRASTRRSTPRTGRWGGTGTPAYAPGAAAAGRTGIRTRDDLAACGR